MAARSPQFLTPQTAEEMQSDTNLIWSNAKIYNHKGDAIYKMAEELQVRPHAVYRYRFP